MANSPHILLLSPFFHPEPISTGRYNAQLAIWLRDQGYRVTAICSEPLYPNWRPTVATAEIEGVRAHRGGAWVRYPAHPVLRRAILELWFAWHALMSCRRLGDVDLVLSVVPPSLGASILPRLLPRSVPVVTIVHDLQATYTKRFGWVSSLVGRLTHLIEGAAFKNSDALIFLSETMRRKAIDEYGIDRDRSEVIYPFPNVTDGPEHSPVVELLRDDRKHVVYSGALGLKQNPDALISVMRELLSQRSDVCCHVFSGGPVFDRLRVENASLPGLKFHDLVEESGLSTLYERSSVQIISEVTGAGEGSLPSKLPNLLWMGVPIFCLCDSGSELAALVESSPVGRVDSTFNPNQQAVALSVFLEELESYDRTAERATTRSAVVKRFGLHQLPHIIRVVQRAPAPAMASQASVD